MGVMGSARPIRQEVEAVHSIFHSLQFDKHKFTRTLIRSDLPIDKTARVPFARTHRENIRGARLVQGSA